MPRRVLVLRVDVLFCIRSCCPPAPPCSNLKPDGPQQKRFCAAALGRAFSLCWLCLCPHAHPPHLPLLLCFFLIIHPGPSVGQHFFFCLLATSACSFLPAVTVSLPDRACCVVVVVVVESRALQTPRTHFSAVVGASPTFDVLLISTQREF